MSHRLTRTLTDHLQRLLPMGLGLTKPKHFRDMLGVIWKNRDNLSYAWQVLTKGVCDGCALGVAGLHDWTIRPKFKHDPTSVHLCMTRLNLLRLNTMPAFDPAILRHVNRLENLSNSELRELGRIPCPLLREADAEGFRRISWDEANQRIATRIRRSHPDRLAFFVTSRGVTNEVYYAAQKTARFLGTNNVDNAARLCHAPSTSAMKHAVGVAATTCSYQDFYGTDLIVFFGANPANDQPVTTKYLHEAKRLGTKIVMVNPYLEPGMKRYWVPSTPSSMLFGTDIADYWFPVTQGGDIAFLYGVLKILFAENWLNDSFVTAHTAGLEDLRRHAAELPWELLERQAGLDRESMREFAGLIRDAKNAVLVWSMGITQHAYGADGVSMILNLGLARGYVGRDLNGLMPIRGHSSVQGGAEMGAYANVFPGGVPINKESAKALADQYGFEIPDHPGLTAVQMVEAAANGRLDLLYCLGGNFLRTLPQPRHVHHALTKVPMRVHQDIVLTDQMFIDAKDEVILLPAKTRYEQDDGGIETSTERRVMFSPEIPRQVGEARAEWKILLDLARAVHPEKAELLGCRTGQAMREEIARVVPFYDGIQNLKQTGDAIQYGGRHLCADGKFPTADGRAHFKTVALPAAFTSDHTPVVSGPEFRVSTRRGKQFNTLIYAEVDPLNDAPRDAVLMNAADATALRLVHLDLIALRNDYGEFTGRVFLAPIARGNLQIHWPEGNVIVPRGIVDAGGGVPDYNTRATVHRL